MEETKKVEQKPKKEKPGLYINALLNKAKIDYMHDKYTNRFSYLRGLKDMLQLYQDSCNDFSKKLSQVNASFITNEITKNPLPIDKEKQSSETKGQSTPEKEQKKTNTSNSACEQLFSLILEQKNEFKKMATAICSINTFPREPKQAPIDKNEKEFYGIYKSLMKDYNYSKTLFQKSKLDYDNNFTALEKIYKDIEEKKTDENKMKAKINKSIESIKLMDFKYKTSTDDVNKKKHQKIQIEKRLLNIYEEFDFEIFVNIKETIWKFIELLKQLNEQNKKLIEDLELKYKEINIYNDINYYIQKYLEDNKKEKELFIEEKFEYKPYEPQAKLLSNYLTGNEKEIVAFRNNFRIIKSLKKNFSNICPNINLEEEGQKLILLALMQKIFYPNPNSQFTKEEKERLISLLNNQNNRKLFIIVLSNQRTKGRFQRGKELINDLGEILNNILNLSEKEKNYEDAKNCIIISQTFYYEAKSTAKKIYLFDFIKKHNWLSSIAFWEEISEFMVEKEIQYNNKILGKDALEKETEIKKKERISQVFISQLLTLSENMIDFGINKKDIFKLLDKCAKKHDILESFKVPILDNINNIFRTQQMNELASERKEISQFFKIRQKTLRIPCKIINVQNFRFNNIDQTLESKISINKKMKKSNSSSFLTNPEKPKKNKNKMFDDIKKEIRDINALIIKSKNKSESYVQKNKQSASMIGNKILGNIIRKDKKTITEIIVEDKKESSEIKEDNKEEPKEEDKNEIKDFEILKKESKDELKEFEILKEESKDEDKKEEPKNEIKQETQKDETKKEKKENKEQ